ncbi:hypothetical protein ACQKCU_25865, partial [Heyndrickxia sporothermodurans]
EGLNERSETWLDDNVAVMTQPIVRLLRSSNAEHGGKNEEWSRTHSLLDTWNTYGIKWFNLFNHRS